MSSTTLFCAITVSESPLLIKMSFLRKYFGAIGVEFLLMSVVCTLVMLSPLARFYVTENDWLLFLVCFLFCASYLSLIRFIKLVAIDLILIFHILFQSFAVGVLVTYNDLMFLYQAIIMSTCTLLGFLLYTLQSKWNFNIWTILLISCICISFTSASLKALFGGTKEENIFSILIAFLILIYHSYTVFIITTTLTPSDFVYALVNVHLLPVNLIVFSSPLYKPVK